MGGFYSGQKEKEKKKKKKMMIKFTKTTKKKKEIVIYPFVNHKVSLQITPLRKHFSKKQGRGEYLEPVYALRGKILNFEKQGGGGIWSETL